MKFFNFNKDQTNFKSAIDNVKFAYMTEEQFAAYIADFVHDNFIGLAIDVQCELI